MEEHVIVLYICIEFVRITPSTLKKKQMSFFENINQSKILPFILKYNVK